MVPYWAACIGLPACAGQIAAADQAYNREVGLEPDPAMRRFLHKQREMA